MQTARNLNHHLKARILRACRAQQIPEGKSGLWTVKKFKTVKVLDLKPPGFSRQVLLPPGKYTQLFRYTNTGAMQNWGLGELVMHDYPYELARHLVFMLRATGRVLITGLGLGCVVRGCLVHDHVTHLTVIEKSPDVLRLVRKHMPEDPRLQIIEADALAWLKSYDGPEFDCAWHDLWTDEDAGEPHLQILHSQLMGELVGKVKFQGAWAFPREFRRQWRELKVI